MKIQCAYISNNGLVRDSNEDSLIIQDILYSSRNDTATDSLFLTGENLFFCVTDGMGGHEGGEIASRVVLESLHGDYKSIVDESSTNKAIQNSKIALDSIAKKNMQAFYGLGTTASGIILKNNQAVIFHIGDCRIYKIENSKIEKLTKDHSIVQYLFDNGMITEDEMRTHPKKNIITSAIIGDMKDECPPADYKSIPVENGNKFLICSDGVWESMTHGDLESCINSEPDSIILTVDRIAKAVMKSGANDNFSMILLEILNKNSNMNPVE